MEQMVTKMEQGKKIVTSLIESQQIGEDDDDDKISDRESECESELDEEEDIIDSFSFEA